MDEHLQLVGVVGLVACLILGVVVIALCIVLFCQKCRSRDSQSRPFVNSESRNSQSLGDDPPDYEWCAENAGYRPDQPDVDSLSNVAVNDEIPPTYDHAVGNVPTGDFVALDVNQLTASEAYKVLAGPRPSNGGPSSWEEDCVLSLILLLCTDKCLYEKPPDAACVANVCIYTLDEYMIICESLMCVMHTLLGYLPMMPTGFYNWNQTALPQLQHENYLDANFVVAVAPGVVVMTISLKRICRYFDEIPITYSTES